MDLIKTLKENALEKSKEYDDSEFMITGQWDIELFFKPNEFERTFHYKIVMIQTRSQGCCYYYSPESALDEDLMGKDARYVTPKNKYLEIALLDSIYSVFNEKPMKQFTLHGTSKEKTVCRTEIVASEVLYQAAEVMKHRQASVVNVGVVGNLIKILKNFNFDVYATDLDSNLVGTKKHGVTIEHGKHTLEYIEKCDVALITGMTISTKSLNDIIEVAKETGTKIVMFAETGAWLAQEYCDSFGIDAVIGEPFPFYIFQGESIIRVHRPREESLSDTSEPEKCDLTEES
jgi:hypothetical protein